MLLLLLLVIYRYNYDHNSVLGGSEHCAASAAKSYSAQKEREGPTSDERNEVPMVKGNPEGCGCRHRLSLPSPPPPPPPAAAVAVIVSTTTTTSRSLSIAASKADARLTRLAPR